MTIPRLIQRAREHIERVAIRDSRGVHSYGDLLAASERRARALLAGRTDLRGERIAYLLNPGFDHVTMQWAIWRAGGVAVPVAVSHPAPEVARLLADARPVALVVEAGLRQRAKEAGLCEPAASLPAGTESDREGGAGVRIVSPGELDDAVEADTLARPNVDEAKLPEDAAPSLEASRAALMVYTSGTTGYPKGAVTTHINIEAQVTALVNAWEWSPDDRILHVLPLHHIHGIVNVLACALWSGACCEFSPPDPVSMWERFASAEVTLFMAVPTIYGRLIGAWDTATRDDRERWSAGARGLRLTVSGSAALPAETLERWEEITGQRLLERYGMTEIGMALGNPLHGERRPGTVGQPFPDVEARIVDDDGVEVAGAEQGEIQVRGAQVFLEYWNRPDETRAAFTDDGWFRTGDDAVVEDGYWRIVGRRSVDIIKTGGYKVSALEIEAVLRQHPDIADVAVVGVTDEEWGERVCAAVVARPGRPADGEQVRRWCKERLAPYKVPKQVAEIGELPRNAMGKVTKPALRSLFINKGE